MVAFESDGLFFGNGEGDLHKGANTVDRNVGVLHGDRSGLLFWGICGVSPVEEGVLGCAVSGGLDRMAGFAG